MTLEYMARRDAKHAAQAEAKIPPAICVDDAGTIDLTLKRPWHSWLNGKLFKSSRGGNKNRSGYGPEQAQANIDNRNPYLAPDGKWYFYDETEQSCETGYVTRQQAEIALADYVTWLNTPKSIGGVPEIGLPKGADVQACYARKEV